jgi:hypothetical protein
VRCTTQPRPLQEVGGREITTSFDALLELFPESTHTYPEYHKALLFYYRQFMKAPAVISKIKPKSLKSQFKASKGTYTAHDDEAFGINVSKSRYQGSEDSYLAKKGEMYLAESNFVVASPVVLVLFLNGYEYDVGKGLCHWSQPAVNHRDAERNHF